MRTRHSPLELELGRLIARRLRFEVDRSIYFADWPKTGTPKRCTPDLLFRRGLVAVFVDGCYYHECPTHNPDAFGGKHRTRDERDGRELAARGWSVLRHWEHDRDLRGFADRVVAEVRARRTPGCPFDHQHAA
jgi:DNA mismatch endonuclease, patch repair protein